MIDTGGVGVCPAVANALHLLEVVPDLEAQHFGIVNSVPILVHDAQEGGKGTSYKTIVPREEGHGLNIGYVVQKGPTYTLPNSHDWNQWYLVIKGQGVIILNDEEFSVVAPSLVTIPPGTKHATQVDDGHCMEYVYVNQFTNNESFPDLSPEGMRGLLGKKGHSG